MGCLLVVVEELMCFYDPERYAGWDINVPGRSEGRNQIKGQSLALQPGGFDVGPITLHSNTESDYGNYAYYN